MSDKIFRITNKILVPVAVFTCSVLFGLFIFGLLSDRIAAAPLPQDPGQQVDIFAGTVVTTTTQTSVTPCGQGGGAIGRKTLSVINESGGGAITVTAELRATQTVSNHTSAHLAINGLAAGSASSDTTTPDEAAGRYCQVSAVSAGTSTITVTLRRE